METDDSKKTSGNPLEIQSLYSLTKYLFSSLNSLLTVYVEGYQEVAAEKED